MTCSKQYLIGNGISDAVQSLAAFVSDARVMPIYENFRNELFLYEALEKPNWNVKVKEIAATWSSDPDNIDRAVRAVGRPLRSTQKLVRGFCLVRFKPRDIKEWLPVDGLNLHLGGDDKGPSTIVVIALEDLGLENGFFVPLKCGQDLCIDSGAEISFPPTGGGKALLLSLSI